MGGKQKFPPQTPPEWGGNKSRKSPPKGKFFTCAAGENFEDWWAVTSAPQAKILTILKSEMQFPKGKSIIWGSDFSKFSRFPPHMGGKYVKFPPQTPPEWGGKTSIFPPQTPPEWGGNNLQKNVSPPHGKDQDTPPKKEARGE